jgi:peptidoglycan/LPS O-acetylase OafA/YrhL
VPEPPARRLGNRPGLTGLRAVAIVVVVARHAGEVWPGGFDASAFGFAGVDIFFVLSGFLITSLLVGEWSRRGSISLGQFYIRRALRLLPALFAFLLVVLILTPFQPDVSHRTLADTVGLSAVFLGNIAKTLHWQFPLPHLWSLGMEEQFYLLWPLLLLVLLRLRAPRFLILAVAVAGVITVEGSRIALHAAGAASAFTLFYSPLHSDGLMIGCALGLAYAWGWVPPPDSRRRLLGVAVCVAALVFVVVAVRGAPYVAWGTTWGLTVIALAAAVFVYAAIDERPVLPLRFLTWGPVIYLGEISYALYLWHFPVLYLWPTNHLSVPGRIAISVGLAAISFEFIEKPFLRKKPQHTPDASERDAALGPLIAPRPAEAPGAGG